MNEMILHETPYISYFYKLFTEEECDYIIKNSTNWSDSIHKTVEQQNHRTSSSCRDFDNKFAMVKEKVYNTIKDKLDDIGIQHIENAQVVRYTPGQQYKTHLDGFEDRIATAILYLNDGFTGGETVFNHLGYSIRPERGSLLFFKYKYNQDINNKTRHEGKPVLNGTKYIANFWIRNKPIQTQPESDAIRIHSNSPVTLTEF